MLTHIRLMEVLKYSPENGEWRWKIDRSTRVRAGSLAGCIKLPDGYRIIKIDCKRYRSARLAWFYMTGSWPYNIADHINRIRLDDRWENIRDVTHKESWENSDHKPPLIRRKYNYPNIFYGGGIYYRKDRNKWRVRALKNNKRISLGNFNSKGEALVALANLG